MNNEIPDSEREVLEFFHNPKFKIENGHIVTFDLEHKNLTSLPESIGNLKSLKILNLKGNKLTSLPEIFSNMPNLKKLNLGCNQLTSLPESMRNLTCLEFLDLSKNQLTLLPEFIKKLIEKPDKKKFKELSLLESQYSGLKIAKNPLRSLSNIPRHVFQKILIELNNTDDIPLVKTGKRLFHKGFEVTYYSDGVSFGFSKKELEELYEFYKKSTIQIAQQYVTDPNSLTPDEKERFIWEAGHNERALLENSPKIPLNDPIIQKITQRISFGDGILSTTPRNSSRTLYGTALNELPRVLHQINIYYDEGTPEAAPQLPSSIMDDIREFRSNDNEIENRYRSQQILSNLKLSRNYNDQMLWCVYTNYKKSTTELLQQYIEKKIKLNGIEFQRLSWEAEIKEYEILERSLPPEDGILIEIRKRLFPKKPKVKLLR